MATALVAHDRAALVLALEVEGAGEPAEQPDAQLRALVAERGGRLLQQLGRPPWSAMPGRQHASS